MSGKFNIEIPDDLDRGTNIKVLDPHFHPPSKGLSHLEGKARLIHDLANIELQAMELALRSLYEFPEAPEQFRLELRDLCLSEGKHFKSCIEQLQLMGFDWGSRPVHTVLWKTVSPEDDLIDRILIVHRYLEGSGLDAGEMILKKLEGSKDSYFNPIANLICFIQKEEIDHVEFGSRWFRQICKLEKRNSDEEFKTRLFAMKNRLPRRLEKVSHHLRLKSGFTPSEIEIVEDYRSHFLISF